MRDVFFSGVTWTIVTVAIVALAVGEIRAAKSSRWWVAAQGAGLAVWIGASVAMIAWLPQ